MLNSITDYIYLLLPIIAGYSTTLICKPGKSAGSLVKFRPPRQVFSIIWPILYILLGLAWVYSKEQTVIYLAINILLCSWLIFYSCFENKQISLYLLLLTLMMLFFAYTNSNKVSQNLIIPLIIWIFFAILLSVFDF